MIRPNASMSPKSALIVFLGFVFLSGAILVRCVLLGAWVVIPFTLIEVVFLGSVFWWVLRSNQFTETILYNKHELKVIRKTHRRLNEWAFQPCWSQVVLQPGDHAWYPDRLLIRSHGQTLEIGMCLTVPEKTSLAKTLRVLLPSGNSVSASGKSL
ncbi:MAG: DUF2244 domain-containing protein [Granulosicoccus sp.]